MRRRGLHVVRDRAYDVPMAKDSPPTADAEPVGDIRDMLDRAKKALDALESGQAASSRPGPLIIGTIVLVVLLAGAGLVVHTFLEKGGPKVDATSVALLAVVLVAPFVPKLRAIELGGAKAQWQEDAFASITEVVAVIGYQHQALDRLYQESIAEAQATDDAEPTPGLASTPPATGHRPPRQLRHVLWVDDQPANNSYELEALRTTAKVTVVADTARAMRSLQVEDIDAVISDIGRTEAGQHVEDAGLRLLRAVNNLHLGHTVPVFFYASSAAVQQHGATLEAEGAMTVTASHRELFAALRAYEIQATRYAVRDIVSKIPDVTLLNERDVGVDYVIELPDGRRVGVEIGSWITRPQMSAFADRVSHLTAARDSGHLDEGWLLIRDEVIDSRRREFAAANGVRLLSLAALRESLRSTRC